MFDTIIYFGSEQTVSINMRVVHVFKIYKGICGGKLKVKLFCLELFRFHCAIRQGIYLDCFRICVAHWDIWFSKRLIYFLMIAKWNT